MTALRPCPRCTQALPTTALYCRRCGFALPAPLRAGKAVAVTHRSRDLYGPLAAALVVLAAAVIAMLWFQPGAAVNVQNNSAAPAPIISSGSPVTGYSSVPAGNETPNNVQMPSAGPVIIVGPNDPPRDPREVIHDYRQRQESPESRFAHHGGESRR